MTLPKRILDVTIALLLSIALSPVIGVIAAIMLLREGRPILYVSERMKTPTQSFRLVKFRTMKVRSGDSGVSGGDKSDRITRFGRFLRRSRLDELPQLWNVLKGDMSFVGPRPPLRQYVEKFPDLYAEVLKARPGITGLASLHLHAYEERVLRRARTPEETDALYSRLCVPKKARVDTLYMHHSTVCHDLAIMMRTVLRVALPGRARRRWK